VFIHYIILLYCSDREPAGNNQARPQILCDELPSAIQLASMVLPSRLARYFDPASMIPMTVQTSLYSLGAYTSVRVPGKQGFPLEREKGQLVFAKGWTSPQPFWTTCSQSEGCKMTCAPELLRCGEQVLQPNVRRSGLEMQPQEPNRAEIALSDDEDAELLSSDCKAAKSAKRSPKYCWTSPGLCWFTCRCATVRMVYGEAPGRRDIDWRKPAPCAKDLQRAIWVALQKPAPEDGKEPGAKAMKAL
jgi:hypothetical protein